MRGRVSAPLPPPARPGDYSVTVTITPSVPPLPWRYVVSEPLDGAVNMAWDQALMARARRTGEAVLRVYAWRRPDAVARPEPDGARRLRPRPRGPAGRGFRAPPHRRPGAAPPPRGDVQRHRARRLRRHAPRRVFPDQRPAPERAALPRCAGCVRGPRGPHTQSRTLALLRRTGRRRDRRGGTEAGGQRPVAGGRRAAAARVDPPGRRSGAHRRPVAFDADAPSLLRRPRWRRFSATRRRSVACPTRW